MSEIELRWRRRPVPRSGIHAVSGRHWHPGKYRGHLPAPGTADWEISLYDQRGSERVLLFRRYEVEVRTRGLRGGVRWLPFPEWTETGEWVRHQAKMREETGK